MNALCNGSASGSLVASASSGTPGYSYLWNTGITSATNSNLTAGTYTVTATDANGCTATLSSVINEPSILNIQTNSVASTCGQSNGSAGVTVSGGTGGYNYLWSTSQTKIGRAHD